MNEDCVEILGVKAKVARTIFARMRGLIGKADLEPGTGLLIPRCRAIHTFFMRFAIDAVFMDAKGNVVKTIRNIPPWRPFVWGGWRAVKVLETES